MAAAATPAVMLTADSLTAGLTAGESTSKSTALQFAGQVDALVRQLRQGDRYARRDMKAMLTAGKLTAKTKDDRGCPILHSVVQGGMATFTFDLINSWNADVNMLDELQNTCLHICTFFGNGEGEWARLATILEEAYCDDCAVNSFGLLASEMTDHNVVANRIHRLLADDLAQQTSPDAGMSAGGARKNGENVAIKAMSRNFVSGQECDEHGRTMLMMAAGAGSMDLVKYLIKIKCHIDTSDNEGNTALHHAVMHGQETVAALIVRKGADTRIRNDAGKTAMQMRAEARAPVAEVKVKKPVKEESVLDRVEEERSPAMEALFGKFIIAANSEAALGLSANARTGRTTKSSHLPANGDEKAPAKNLARTQTMNYSEFLVFLRSEGLMPQSISLNLAAEVFRRVGKEFAHEEGFEVSSDFHHMIADRLGLHACFAAWACKSTQ